MEGANAYDVLRILQAFMPGESASQGSSTKWTAAEPNPHFSSKQSDLTEVAAQIDSLYTSDRTAPNGWHLKEGLRKSLRQEVRKIVLKAKFSNWKDIPIQIEEYALKHYVKMS